MFTFYLRDCCSAIATTEKIQQPTATKSNQDICHREVIGLLTAHNAEWWKTCYINEASLLQSDDPVVQQWLKPSEEFYCAAISAIAHQIVKPESRGQEADDHLLP